MKGRKYFVVLSVVVFFLTSISIVHAATITIQPSSADSYVDQAPAKANDNFGTSPDLKVASDNSKNERSFVKFDLSTIPPDVVITSAVLALYVNSVPSESRNYEVQRVAGDWTEGGITWNNQLGVSGTAITNSTGTANNVWLYWDVKTDVQAFYSGSVNNYGWRIKDSAEDSSPPKKETSFNSKESGVADRRPRLEITYEQKTCDITATSPINFGTMIPGEISSDVTSTVSMPTGNQVVIPTIEGTD
jgi:hypothetical protein